MVIFASPSMFGAKLRNALAFKKSRPFAHFTARLRLVRLHRRRIGLPGLHRFFRPQ